MSLTKYAEIVCIIDKDYSKFFLKGYKVDSPSNINKYKYDYVIIAVVDYNISKNIVIKLKEMMISIDKIVYDIRYFPDTVKIRNGKKISKGYYAYKKTFMSMAIHMPGGLGDMVVYKRYLEEIEKWPADIVIDVYIKPDSSVEMMKNIIAMENVNLVVGEDFYIDDEADYAIEFEWGTDIYLSKYNESYLSREPSILEIVKKIKDENGKYGQLGSGKWQAIHYARCEKDGLWRYTAYNRYTGFNVVDYHTNIPLNYEYYDKASSICNGKYITINYGWGGTVLQAKVWPKKYNEELIKQIHKKFPDIIIVQVGGDGFPKLNGADIYAFGLNLDIVKFILKNSMIHIDCEGGLVHLATQLGTRCIVLFGPTPIKFYGYPENINIQAGSCHNCYWLVDNFYECYRGLKEPECMYSISPELVFDKLNNYFHL